MLGSKLVKVFLSLDKKELRQLRKWLQSPMHNEHQEVCKLFGFLMSRYNLNATTLKKERVWKYIYGDKEYKDLRMRHLMSFALEVLEEFVSYKSLKSNGFLQEKVRAEHYFNQKLIQPARQSIKKASNKLQKIQAQNEEYHLNQYQLEVLKFDFLNKEIN